MARILIVDDDPDIVEASQLLLERQGHSSRLEGMRRVESFQPDLMILDVMMAQPDDGIAMAQDLRRLGKKFPILMLTSVATASGLAFDKDPDMVPVDAFQAKPVEPAILLNKVAELLERRTPC
jgi:CheY-like chemotaxis protein